MFISHTPKKPISQNTGTVPKTRMQEPVTVIEGRFVDFPGGEGHGAWGDTRSDPTVTNLNLTATLVVPPISPTNQPNGNPHKRSEKTYPKRKRTTTRSSDYIQYIQKNSNQLPRASENVLSESVTEGSNLPPTQTLTAETVVPPARGHLPARELFEEFGANIPTRPPPPNVAAKAFEMLASLRTGADRASNGSQLHEWNDRDLESRRSTNINTNTARKHTGTGPPRKRHSHSRVNTSVQEIEVIRETQKGQSEILMVLSEQIRTLTSLVNKSLNVVPTAPNTIDEPNGNVTAPRYDNFPLPDPSIDPATNNRTNVPTSTGPGNTCSFDPSLHRNHPNPEMTFGNNIYETRHHHLPHHTHLNREPMGRLNSPHHTTYHFPSPPQNQSADHSYRRSPLAEWKVSFDGSNSSNVGEFLSKVETIAEGQRITLEHICNNFFLLLKGRAKDWYFRYRKDSNIRNQPVTWLNLRSAIKRQFQHHRNSCEVLKAILERRQGESEPFEDFYHAIVTLRSQSEEYISDDKSSK